MSRFLFNSLLSTFILFALLISKAFAAGEAPSAVSSKLNWDQIKIKHVQPVLVKATDQTSLTLLGLGAGSVFLAQTQDDYTRERWVRNQQMDSNVSSVGDFLGTGAGSLLVMGGQYLVNGFDDDLQSHARGFVYGGVVIYSLKTVVNRKRPGGSRSYQSFPSGHTTITFMTATHLTYAYGWKASAVAYPLAVLTGASRLADDAHWFSDVVGGAFLGFIVGRATYYSEVSSTMPEVEKKSESQASFKPRLDIFPLLSHESWGTHLVYQF